MSNFGKSLKYGLNVFILTVIILLIIIIINFFSYQYNLRLDLTRSEKYSLSEQTKKVLRGLKNEIKIICFFQEEAQGKASLKELLREYSYSSKKIKFEFLDPDKNPRTAKAYNVNEYNTILIESNNQVSRIKGSSEQDITNAIIKITRKAKKIIYFVEGHGEKDIEGRADNSASYSMLKDSLLKQSYGVKKISLLTVSSIPAECSVIIIGGPKKEISSNEKEILNSYLLKGGNGVFLLDPDSGADMEEFLKTYGVRMEKNFIIDKTSQILGGDYFIPVISTYGNHEITKNFNYTTFFPLARSVSSAIGKDQTGLTFTPLAITSENSLAKKNPDKIEFNPKEDEKGPLNIACAVTKTNQGKNGKDTRIVVFGDSDFISNAYFNLSGNGDLFLNSLNWLAEEEDLISIRPRPIEFTNVQISKRKGYFIFYLSVIIIPASILVLGGIIWIRRRRL